MVYYSHEGGLVSIEVTVAKPQILWQGFYQIRAYPICFTDQQNQAAQSVRHTCIMRQQAAVVLPYDPVRQEIGLIEQFRIGCFVDRQRAPFILECVAGLIESGQTPAATAARELAEEAGITDAALTLHHHYFVDPKISNEQVHLFFAKVRHKMRGGVFGLEAEHEEMRLHIFSYDQVKRLLHQGQIYNAATLLALSAFFAGGRQRAVDY
jgi:ADP-ribose pyrophosphatase